MLHQASVDYKQLYHAVSKLPQLKPRISNQKKNFCRCGFHSWFLIHFTSLSLMFPISWPEDIRVKNFIFTKKNYIYILYMYIYPSMSQSQLLASVDHLIELNIEFWADRSILIFKLLAKCITLTWRQVVCRQRDDRPRSIIVLSVSIIHDKQAIFTPNNPLSMWLYHGLTWAPCTNMD